MAGMDSQKDKARNDFNLAAGVKKKIDNTEDLGKHKGPGGQPDYVKKAPEVEARLKRGNEIHMKAMNNKPKSPEPGR